MTSSFYIRLNFVCTELKWKLKLRQFVHTKNRKRDMFKNMKYSVHSDYCRTSHLKQTWCNQVMMPGEAVTFDLHEHEAFIRHCAVVGALFCEVDAAQTHTAEVLLAGQTCQSCLGVLRGSARWKVTKATWVISELVDNLHPNHQIFYVSHTKYQKLAVFKFTCP